MDNFRERFTKIWAEVEKYATEHSHLSFNRTDFQAYRSLVALGKPALPYLRKKIGEETSARWYVLLAARDIIQDSGHSILFPSEIAGNLSCQESYLAGYLDREFRFI